MIALISVEGVSKRYAGTWVLRDVRFFVERGQIAAIIGKNGCGKSTLLSIVAGMLKPDEGAVSIGGAPAGSRGVGYVSQGDCLFEELTVRDNLAFWASAASLPSRGIEHNPYVRLLGLDRFLGKRVSRLSGGMRRRTAICTALLGNPACLLLDEPFTGLDLIYRQELSRFLLELRRASGITLLYTTHSPEELSSLSDTTLLLADGRILRHENTRELLRGEDIQSKLINLIRGENRNERG